jgi:hypothetical protein
MGSSAGCRSQRCERWAFRGECADGFGRAETGSTNLTVEPESSGFRSANLRVPLGKERPQLGGVFGPLSTAENRAVWSAFSEADGELTRLAAHHEHAGAGLLELAFSKAGGLEIAGYVSTSDGNVLGADFCVELTPVWCLGGLSGESAWDIEAAIYVDCQHRHYHRSMDMVWNREVRRDAPDAAATALAEAARELYRLGSENSLDYWLSKAKDD